MTMTTITGKNKTGNSKRKTLKRGGWQPNSITKKSKSNDSNTKTEIYTNTSNKKNKRNYKFGFGKNKL